MDSRRWKRVRAVLEQALALETEARAGFLSRECAGDPELEREVADLLAGESRGEGLEPPTGERVARALGASVLGSRVGGYVLERVLGSGGMGTVYLARREVDGFTQRVALKLVRGGMDSAETLRRFRTERAVLASLQHECIARFHDGGSTPDGQPWYAMEYVEGRPIDQTCDERHLGTRARVALFLEVCEAVQHAHGKLVVHRDLKPANILVTGDGHVKLLDFGIAKLLESDAAQATLTGQRALTPAYASPEQLRGEPSAIASDVYSLGVVLYELLAGARPFASPTAIVVGRAPERPSATVLRSSPAAAARGGSPERIARELRGDLDTILLKALHEDPARRYATVEALAEDLRRHLAGRTVLARPDTVGYRVRTFVRRHRIPVVLASAALLALVLGLTGTLAMYFEADEQATLAKERLADVERARSAEREQRELAERRFQDVRELASQFLFDFHDAIADLPGATRARERIVSTGLTYLDRLAADDVGHDLRFELARGFQQVAKIQRPRRKAGLEEPARALATLERARGLYSELLASDAKDPNVRRYLGELLCDRYLILSSLGRSEEAGADLERSTSLLTQLADEGFDARELAVPLAGSLLFRGREAMARGAFDEARTDLSSALEWARRAADEDDPEGRRAYAVVAVRSSLADLTSAAGDPAAALEERIAITEEANRIVREHPLSSSFRRASAELERWIAMGLLETGRADEAIPHADLAVTHLRELASFDPADTSVGHALASAETTAGQARHQAYRPTEAIACFLAALEWLEPQHGRQPEDALTTQLLGNTLCLLGLAEIFAQETDEGRAHARTGLELLAQLADSGLSARASQEANVGKVLYWAASQQESHERRLLLLDEALETLDAALADFAELREQGRCLPAEEQAEERCRKLVALAQDDVDELIRSE